MDVLDNIYENIRKTVIDCGELMLNANKSNISIRMKEGNGNFVTEYDVLIQNKLQKELLELMPDAGFIGEENDFQKDIKNEYVFIVDPIDGTTNFARDIKTSAISVALLKDKKPIFAFCYNAYINEMYEAKKGYGAFLNGREIHVSNKKLKEGIAECGTAPYYDDLKKRSIEIHNIFASIASDVRRFGSAVIEICNVASGKAELYFELKLMPWDYAAASLILEEAGGTIKTIEGENIQFFNPTSILASNGLEDYSKYIK